MNIRTADVAGWIFIFAGSVLVIPLSPSWPALVATGALLAAAQLLSINERDRLIFRAFAGVPFVIALASAYFWAGVIAQCGILVLLLSREGIVAETSVPVIIFTTAGSVFLLGAVIDISNHMRIPFLAISAGILACAGILWIRMYRLKRIYRSPVP